MKNLAIIIDVTCNMQYKKFGNLQKRLHKKKKMCYYI